MSPAAPAAPAAEQYMPPATPEAPASPAAPSVVESAYEDSILEEAKRSSRTASLPASGSMKTILRTKEGKLRQKQRKTAREQKKALA